MMTRTLQRLSTAMLAVACLATTASAHSGHGHPAVDSGPLHYWLTTEHLIESILLTVGLFAAGWVCWTIVKASSNANRHR